MIKSFNYCYVFMSLLKKIYLFKRTYFVYGCHVMLRLKIENEKLNNEIE
jgi:hypothetical protein